MRDHTRTELTAALMIASQRRKPAAGLVCHSDRGSQYAAETYRKQLAGIKALPSMSRTACCYNDAPMESFFHTLRSSSFISDDRRRGTTPEATCSHTSKATTKGSASTRPSATSRLIRPRGRGKPPCPRVRGRVTRIVTRLEDWRCIATRYD